MVVAQRLDLAVSKLEYLGPDRGNTLPASCMSADEQRLGHTATGVACDGSHFASPVWEAGELVLVAPPNGFAAVVAAAFHVDEKRLIVKTRHDSVDVMPVEGIEVARKASPGGSASSS